MSRLVDHARQELQACGQYAEDPAYAQSIIAAVAAFTSYDGHSGGSFPMAVDHLTRLLNGETLTPLTDDPDEWEDRSAISGVPMWQNNRNSAAISYDAGRTYQLMTDTADELPIYISKAAHAAPDRPRAPGVPEPPRDPDSPAHGTPGPAPDPSRKASPDE